MPIYALDDSSQQMTNTASPDDPSQSSSQDTTATTATLPAQPAAAQAQAQQPTSQPSQASPQSQQPPPQPAQTQPAQTVSNEVVNHPAVQRANVLRTVAETLAGGPRFTETIDPSTGASVRQQVPLSSRDIGMAIALSALSGGIAGLGQSGPNAIGRAAAAGFDAVSQQQQLAQQQQQQAAQQQFENEGQTLIRRANAFESNSRAILNTSQAERYGLESLKDAVDQNAQLLNDYDEAGAVQENHISQDALQAGLQSGRYKSTDQIAIPDGYTNLNGRYEQTFSIVANPAAKVPLTQAQAKIYADAGVPGFAFAKSSGMPNGVSVPGYMLSIANQRMQAINLMKADFSSVSDALANSGDAANNDLAKSIPNIGDLLQDKDSGPALNNALSKFQKYTSHSDQHGMDLYESLQMMAQPSKPDPRNPKQFVPNPDTGAAQTIAGAFGDGDPQKGWAILRAYHQELAPTPVSSESQAEAVIADPDSSTKAKMQAQQFLTVSRDQKASESRADALARVQVEQTTQAAKGAASGNPSDVMSLGEALARGSLTEDQVPGFGRIKSQVESYLSQHHPNLDQSSLQMTSEERKRKDLALNAISNLNTIQSALTRRPDLLGIIQGRVSQGRELAGTDDADLTAVSTALDNYSLAATGAHSIRSVEARRDAKQVLLNGFKNGSNGVNSSINTAKQSLQEFANAGKPKGIDGSPYIYRAQGSGQQSSNTQSGIQQPSAPTSLTNFQVNQQTGQRIGWNGSAWVDAKTGQKVQ